MPLAPSDLAFPKCRGDLLDLLLRHGRLFEPMTPQGVEIPARCALEGRAQVVRSHLAPSVAGGEVVQRRLKAAAPISSRMARKPRDPFP